MNLRKGILRGLGEDPARNLGAGLALRPKATFGRRVVPGLRREPTRGAPTICPRAAWVLALLVITSVVLTPRSGSANPGPPETSPSNSANTSRVESSQDSTSNAKALTPGRAASGEPGRVPHSLIAHPPKRAMPATVIHRQPMVNNRPRASFENSRSPIRSDRIGAMVRPGPISSQPGHVITPVRTVSAIRPVAPLHSNVPHRGPNPAVVNGSESVHRSGSGAISGSGMTRRR
jgi:hypothetical protein